MPLFSLDYCLLSLRCRRCHTPFRHFRYAIIFVRRHCRPPRFFMPIRHAAHYAYSRHASLMPLPMLAFDCLMRADFTSIIFTFIIFELILLLFFDCRHFRFRRDAILLFAFRFSLISPFLSFSLISPLIISRFLSCFDAIIAAIFR
jgi:hypothetical protein